MAKRYSKWWGLMILAVALMVIPCFLMPQILSHYDQPGSWLASTDFQKDDLLNFYASFFTFFSTILLGVATVFLSQQANDMNRRLIKIEENNYIPTIDINCIAPEELKEFTLKDVFSIGLNDSAASIDEKMNLLCTPGEEVLVLAMTNVSRTDIINIELHQLILKLKYPGEDFLMISYDDVTVSLNNKVPYQSTIPFLIGGIPMEEAMKGLTAQRRQREKDEMEEALKKAEQSRTAASTNAPGSGPEEAHKADTAQTPSFVEEEQAIHIIKKALNTTEDNMPDSSPVLTVTLEFRSTNFLGETYAQRLKFDLISLWDQEINFPAVENKRNIMIYSV